MLLYSALLSLGLLLMAPWWLWRMATTARYREGLRERLGRVPKRLRAAIAGRQVIWVHAVSVGEVLAVSRLVGELEARLNGAGGVNAADARPWCVVVSTTTRTGQAVARERFGADRVFYLPLDFAFAVRAFLRVLQPALLVLTESELWPRLLHECRRRAIPMAVVNARVSDRSFGRARRLRPLWRHVLGDVSQFLAQSEGDAERLRLLGAPPAAVHTPGNLKFDTRPPQPSPLVAALRILCTGHPLVVAGSTVAGEDELVLSAFAEIQRAVPQALLLLAPRHPERFNNAVALAEPFGVLRASSLLDAFDLVPWPQPDAPQPTAPQPDAPVLDAAVIVLDTIGDLAAAYALADVAFIGGSLVAHGGHNPLEAARFGVPVLCGPSYENFREIVLQLQQAGGVEIVADEEEFTAVTIALLTNPEQALSLGKAGQTVFAEKGGATARSIEYLMTLLPTSARTPHAPPLPAPDDLRSTEPTPACEVSA